MINIQLDSNYNNAKDFVNNIKNHFSQNKNVIFGETWNLLSLKLKFTLMYKMGKYGVKDKSQLFKLFRRTIKGL